MDLQKQFTFHAARYGGDEFMIILPGKEKDQFLNSLMNQFQKPFILSGTEYHVNTSIGLSHFPEDADSPEDLLTNADLAMYEIKKTTKNGYCIYNKHLRDFANERSTIENTLKDACENDGFTVVYQPQISVSDCKICGYEALLRLKDSILSPAEFIPIAEDAGLMTDIGRIVTKTVLRQMLKWRSQGMHLVPIAINFSRKQIQDTEYVSFLSDLLKRYCIAPELIEIEITESVFIENTEEAIQLFQQFIDAGVRLALDDFGVGYSSMNYLTLIPVSKLKLDKNFTTQYLQPSMDSAIEDLIHLAHSLNLTITVEGIEHIEQYKRLMDFQCDYAQGYLFSKPVPPESFVSLDRDFSQIYQKVLDSYN